ncbi:MAG TPA: TerC family protein [Gemmatimonadaceae bacterium]|nr:TerC family protein [Gemmatimonadaceae bacterium]
MWGGFLAFVLTLLTLDLGVFNKQAHTPSMKEASAFTAVTVALALAFACFIYQAYDHHWAGLGAVPDALDHRVNDGRFATVKFLTGYIVEMSLSMDNVFVIALIFEHLRIPRPTQHRVLFWGILGALAMRGTMIAGGAALVARFEWILYLFGIFLVVTALRMLFVKENEEALEESLVVHWLNKRFRVTTEFHGSRFRITKDGKSFITPLMVALVLVETTDLIFAVDSIPAIFAITTDAFLVFTSNVFAILCLRSLYFALTGLIEKFRYLKMSLAVLLGIVGLKMLTAKWSNGLLGDNANLWMLGVVIAVLAAGGGASLLADAGRSGDASG